MTKSLTFIKILNSTRISSKTNYIVIDVSELKNDISDIVCLTFEILLNVVRRPGKILIK